MSRLVKKMVKKGKSGYQKTQSRKWRLTLLVVIISTLGVFIPPIVSSWIFGTTPLIIISGTEYVSVLTLIVSAYFGANVIQKRFDGKASVNIDANITTNEDNENGEA